MSDAWYAVYHPALGASVVPVQLLEALALSAIAGLAAWRLLSGKGRHNLSLYLALYGLWRYWIELLRADERGAFFLSLSPSQLLSVVMLSIAFGLFYLRTALEERKRGATDEA